VRIIELFWKQQDALSAANQITDDEHKKLCLVRTGGL
jgi:hypothetical protein